MSHREPEAGNRRSVDCVQDIQREVRVRGGEVEIGGEPARTPGAVLPQRGAALEHQALVEPAFLVQQEQQVILGDVQDRRVPCCGDAFEVPDQMPFGDHAPVPPLINGARSASVTFDTGSWRLPGLRVPNHTGVRGGYSFANRSARSGRWVRPSR